MSASGLTGFDGIVDKWRGRVGMIHPRVCCDMEIYDFYRVAPPDVVLVTTHLEVNDSARADEIELSLTLLERAVERLMASGVSFILKNGVPLQIHHGPEGHHSIVERLRAASNVPVTTGAEALMDAFNTLNRRNILLISSWRAQASHLVEKLESVFATRGVGICAVEGLGRDYHSFEKNRVTQAMLVEQVVWAHKRHPEAEAVYIQSGTLSTVPIIDMLEQRIGKPVVSSNSANAWAYFRHLGLRVKPGFGELLSTL